MLIADLLVFYPSVFLVLRRLLASARDGQHLPMALWLVLVNPTLLVIDHGHFQYNSLSLGLAQLAIGCIFINNNNNTNKWLVYASGLFCMALNYKQMELYHALPFFFYLLGVCLKQDSLAKRFLFSSLLSPPQDKLSCSLCPLASSVVKLAVIGLTVIASFLVLWAPFLDAKLELALQVLSRIFPFSRGLFEVNNRPALAHLFSFHLSFLSPLLVPARTRWPTCGARSRSP